MFFKNLLIKIEKKVINFVLNHPTLFIHVHKT